MSVYQQYGILRIHYNIIKSFAQRDLSTARLPCIGDNTSGLIDSIARYPECRYRDNAEMRKGTVRDRSFSGIKSMLYQFSPILVEIKFRLVDAHHITPFESVFDEYVRAGNTLLIPILDEEDVVRSAEPDEVRHRI